MDCKSAVDTLGYNHTNDSIVMALSMLRKGQRKIVFFSVCLYCNLHHPHLENKTKSIRPKIPCNETLFPHRYFKHTIVSLVQIMNISIVLCICSYHIRTTTRLEIPGE